MEKSSKSPLPLVDAYTVFDGLEVKELEPDRRLIASLFDIALRTYEGTEVEDLAARYYQEEGQSVIDLIYHEQSSRFDDFSSDKNRTHASRVVATRVGMPVGSMRLDRIRSSGVSHNLIEQSAVQLSLRYLGDLAISNVIIDPAMKAPDRILATDAKLEVSNLPESTAGLQQGVYRSMAQAALLQFGADDHPIINRRLVTFHDLKQVSILEAPIKELRATEIASRRGNSNELSTQIYRSKLSGRKILDIWNRQQAITRTRERV